MGADCLVLVDRVRKTAKVVEQKKNPVTPGFEGVQPVLKAWERLNLPEKFEMSAGDAICVLWNYLDADCPKQVGPEGHDVAARVDRLGVRVQRDDGRVVRSECMDKCVLQARLVIDLILKARSRPRGVIGGRMTEGVVQDQRPAGSAFVVLPKGWN